MPMGNDLNNALDAEMILNHPLYRNAHKQLRESMVEDLEACDVSDKDALQAKIIGLQALKAVQTRLESYITNAQMQAVTPEEF